MKTMNKKILTGTLAASVLIGGGITGAFYNKAFAATDGTSPAASASPAPSAAAPADGHFGKGGGHARHGEGFGFRGFNEAQEAATILGVDQTAIRDLQAQGKTLAQIAQDKGVTEEVLLQKLSDAAAKSIDAAVTSGSITQAQADQQKSGLADRLKKEVEEVQQNDGRGPEGRGQGPEGRGGFADPAALAQILGVTEQELGADLQAGKSLAEIAQAKGIAKDQLVSKIKDSLTDKITKFVDDKHTRPSAPAGAPSAAPDAAAAVPAN